MKVKYVGICNVEVEDETWYDEVILTLDPPSLAYICPITRSLFTLGIRIYL